MPHLLPLSFPDLAQCDAISPASLQSHLALYEGYVEKYNKLSGKLAVLWASGPGDISAEAESIKTDMTYALSAIKNHELFFENLATQDGMAEEPTGALAEALVKSFHSIPRYLMDLKQTANLARGWAWTVYDLDHHFLINYGAGTLNSIPVWNSVPIVAIDLYGHAYFYDYGSNRLAYIESVMKAINWDKVAARLSAAKSCRAVPVR